MPRLRGEAITFYKLTCQRCGHQWIPVKNYREVRICPKCKSASWDIPKKVQ